MPFGTPDVAQISKLFSNSLVAWVQRRRHRHARWAKICNQLARGRSLSAARVSRQTDPLPLLSWRWPNRNDAPHAWRRLYHGRPANLFRLRSVQCRLPWQRLSLELSRSSDSYRGLLRRFLLIMFAMLRMYRQDFLRMLNRWPNDNITSVRSRNRAADQDNFFGFAHLHDLQILNRNAFIPQMTRHSHVFPNTARSRTIADRTNAPMRFRTVCRALSMKVVLFHHALKSFSLRSPNHIDIVARLKLCNAQIDFAFRKIIDQAKFADEFLRLHARLFEFAKQRFGH